MNFAPAHGEWRLFFSFLRNERRRLATALILVVFTNLLQFAVPYYSRRVIDGLQSGEASVQPLALVIAGIALLNAALRMWSRVGLLDAARHTENRIRHLLFRQLTRLSPAFYQRRGIGDLMGRCTSDLNQVRALISPMMLLLANVGIGYAIAIPAMIQLDPQLTLVALAPVLPLIVVLRTQVQRVFLAMRKAQEKLGRLSAFCRQNFMGQLTVKSFGREESEVAAFERVNGEYFAAQMQLARGQAAMAVLFEVTALFSAMCVLGVGARGLLNGTLTLGGYTAFSVYLAELAHRSTLMGFFLAGWQRGRASLSRVDEVLRETPEIVDSHADERRQLLGAVEISGLSIDRGSRRVLSDVSFSVPAGAAVAIVGRTGAGKSTLLEALGTLLAVRRGMLRFDGHDLHDWPLRHLREQMGSISQEPFLFSTSWRNNVSLGRAASPAQIEAAFETAQLSADVALTPGGLDAVVGERGSTLSGGQRSRTALARALLGKPAVMLLDDPFANVDAQVAAKMWEQLRASFRSTTLLVTHRLSLAMKCDQIVVLENGAVAEQGTHSELMIKRGVYARLFEREAHRAEGAR